jgi:hypothetical protein
VPTPEIKREGPSNAGVGLLIWKAWWQTAGPRPDLGAGLPGKACAQYFGSLSYRCDLRGLHSHGSCSRLCASVTVIVVVPSFTPVTLPFAFTVAIASSDDDQVHPPSGTETGESQAFVPAGVNWTELPTLRLVVAGETATLDTTEKP